MQHELLYKLFILKNCRGVISVRGNWPLVPTMDVVVPHTRCMADMLDVLDVLVADDPLTRGDFWRAQPWVPIPSAAAHRPPSYAALAAGATPVEVPERDRLVDVTHGIDGKPAVIHGVHNLFTQHQVLDVVSRDDDAVTAIQSAALADLEEALDLFVDAANGLHLAELVDRSGHGQGLLQRQAGQGGHQSVEAIRTDAIGVRKMLRGGGI